MIRAAKRKLSRVLVLLSAAYGRPRWKCWGKALDVLVETILSQNTNNANSSAGYRQLRRRFRTWADVADAPVGEVEKCIRVSGLSRIKTPRIQKLLRQIRDARQGADVPSAAKRRISLEFLRDWDLQRANRYLLSFDGVGPKTAACVLLFSFHMPIFPVDTHIHRIAIRLGLVEAGAGADDVQELLTPLIAPKDRYAMHILLIAHGRKTCRAISPRCAWCDLRAMCRYAKAVTGIR
jgi:endonuclease-3